MDAEKKKKFVKSFTNFLQSELTSSTDGEFTESIEVARDVLYRLYSLDNCPEPSCDLYGLYQSTESDKAAVVSEQDCREAEALKTTGNEHMSHGLFEEAIAAYSSAVALHPSNPVFYCNRAAAYSRLNKFQLAVDDCDTALRYDPNYAKAYSRKGLALSSMGQTQQAIVCYEKAVQLEPENATFLASLNAERKRIGAPSATPAAVPPFGMPGFGLGNISQILQDPNAMGMITQMMGNPQVQQMMNNLLGSGVLGSLNVQAGAAQGGAGGMDNLLSMGQRMAEQMQQANPELVARLRQMSQQNVADDSGGANGDAANPSSAPPPRPPSP